MPTCKTCKIEFKTFAIIDGVRRDIHKRRHCLDCHPWNGKDGPTPHLTAEEYKRSVVNSHLKFYYNMTIDQFDALNAACDGKCMICSGGPIGNHTRLSVDHDHATGKIRGLLCNNCNPKLGWLEKNLDKVLEYLGITNGQTT